MVQASNFVPLLRRIAYVEGWSYILLLFVAMPLKYLLDQPLAVRLVGAAHGGLFLALLAALLACWIARRWSVPRVALVGVASLVPFGTFWADRHLARWQREG
ncbi:MAG TPA: DUF3817 domain-containing protein [Fibrobacteria bacterium]|nr:DUF3817 domain-containing protein [Fibrobacteria bacterium]